MKVWGRAQEPPAGSRGRTSGQGAPLKLEHFWFLDVKSKPQICPIFYNLKMQRHQIFVLFLQKKSRVLTKLGEAGAKLRSELSPGPDLKPPPDGWPFTASVRLSLSHLVRVSGAAPSKGGVVSALMTLMNFPRPLRHGSAGKGPS